MERAERFILLGLLVVSCLLLYVARGLELPAATGYKVGDDLWPKIILTGLIIAVGLSLFFGWKKQARSAARVREPNESWVRWGVIVGMSAVYAYMLQYIGFLVLTPFFMAAFMHILGLKKIPPLIGLSILLTAVFFFLFRKVLVVPLPLGLWFFKEFSLLFL